MKFRIIMKSGKELPFKLNLPTTDTDVAVYQAKKKIGLAGISHAIKA